MSKLYVVSGPSGAGKGTVCDLFLKAHPEVFFSVSCTTRAMRAYEQDGREYHFIDEAAFEQMRLEGGLLECSHHAGAWYGTPLRPVREAFAGGRDVLLEIENNGAMQVLKTFPEAVSVFILPPSRDDLITRLVYRGSEKTIEKIRQRIAKVPSELEAARRYDCLILNDVPETAAEKLARVFAQTYDGRRENAALLDALRIEFCDEDQTERALTRIFAAYHDKNA